MPRPPRRFPSAAALFERLAALRAWAAGRPSPAARGPRAARLAVEGLEDRVVLTSGPVPNSIGDRCWVDSNADGVQTAGEPGLGGVTVTLWQGGTLVASRLSDPDGTYRFTGLSAGSYQVQFAAPFGYTLTAADAGGSDAADSDPSPSTGFTPTVALAAGQVVTDVDAGFTATSWGSGSGSGPAKGTGAIGDLVWVDADNDGVQDAGEPGLGGVPVYLLWGGQVVASQYTTSSGGYSFTGLGADTYQVSVPVPDGYKRSPAGQGGNPALDSDAAVATGVTPSVTLAAGQVVTAVDAGLVPLSPSLSVAVSDGASTYTPGGTTTYTVTVANAAGADGVTGVAVSVPFGAQFAGATWTAAGAGGAAGFTTSGSGAIGDLVNLPAGGSVTYTVVATVSAGATGNLTVTATATPPVGSAASASDTDTPAVPAVSVAVSPSSVLEDGAANLVYTFTRTGSTAGALTVNFGVSGTALLANSDYTPSGAASFGASGTVTFAAGSSTATVTIDPAADAAVEPDETVALTVSAGTGYAVGSPAAATGTIANDDAGVSVALVGGSSVAEDGTTNLVYRFTRTGTTAGSLTANVGVSGTAKLANGDYTQSGAATLTDSTGTVTFGPGVTTVDVTVDPTADTTVEPDETLTLAVNPGTGYTPASPTAATGTIANDDAAVSVAVSPSSVAEDGTTNLVYTFTRTGTTAAALTVNFNVGGTALLTNSDYTQTGAATFGPSSGTVTFAAGSSTATVTIDPAADAAVEPDETLTLTVNAGTGYTPASPTAATGTIANDDAAADLALSVTDGQAAYVPGTNVTYTVTVSNAGPSNAQGVTFSDPLPAGTTFVSLALPAGWTRTDATAVGANGTIAASRTAALPAGGAAETITVVLNVPAGFTGNLANTPSVAATTPDPVTANNSATDTDTLAPDLRVTVDDGQATYVPGRVVRYTVAVTNAGGTGVTGATVTDLFPALVNVRAWSAVYSAGSSGPAGGAGNINAVAVNLAAGGTATFTADALVLDTATGNLVNTATVTAPSGVTEVTTGNNTAADTDTPVPPLPPRRFPPGPPPCPVGPFTADANTGPKASMFSASGAQFADGTITVGRTDLSSGGFGSTWGSTWSWSSAPGYSDGTAGNGATSTQAPHLVQAAGDASIAVVTNATTAFYFDLVAGAYQSQAPGAAALALNTTTHQFVLTDDAGRVFTFYDFSGSTPAGRAGKLLSVADPAGGLTQVTSWDAAGRPTEVQRTSGTGTAARTESFVTTYVASGANAGLVDTVTQRSKVGTNAWVTTRTTQNAYYDGTAGLGFARQLKLAVVKDAAGAVVSTDYYRYHTSGAGAAGLLSATLGTQSYGQLTAALGTNVDALTDAQVLPYADRAVTYDAAGRVATVVDAAAGCSVCSGGQGTFGYTYATNPAAPPAGYNTWATKTVETLPDGSTNTVYANAYGQPMLKAFRDVAGGNAWVTYTRYDAAGRVTLSAAPSAVTGYDDTKADLVDFVAGNATYLSDAAGLVTAYTYGSTTTALAGTPGDVAGYLKQVDLRHGETGAPVPQESVAYVLRAATGGTFFHVATDTVYRNDDGTGAQTTTYAYTFQGSTNQVASVTTTLPAVSPAQNGSGAATAATTVYDAAGRPVWSKDQAGYITYTEYDPTTGAVVKTIADVNTAQTTTFANLPSGWASFGSPRHLTTTYAVDALGRTTKETSPAGRVTYTVYNDAAHEVRTYAGWNTTTNAPTGPTTVTRQDLAGGYTESLTMTATPTVSGGAPTGAEAIAAVQSLSRSYLNTAGQTVCSDAYFNLGGLAYSAAANLGTEGVNFYRTRYAYDNHGQLNKTTTPQGTISRTVFDGQGRAVSAWVGTDDTPTTGFWSPTNLVGTDMVKVAEYEYDGGGVGDGNVTKATAYPGGGAAARVSRTWYDWRDRAVAAKAGVEATEDAAVNRPLTYTDYDNLGEVVKTRVYDADGVTPTVTNEVPQPLAAGLLRAQATASYDELGRAYRTDTYAVDPATGAVSANALHSDTWYDSRGNAVKTASPGGVVQKAVFDGAGFNTITYVSDGGGDATYADALTVTGDTVLDQTERTFDLDGNVTSTLTRQRFHDATGTGALGTRNTGVFARVSYAGYYYDLAGRPTDLVDVGTNAGSAWTRPATVPARSDTVLVSSTTYAADAVQTVRLTGGPTGGTFTLSFGGQTTAAIAYNATPATVQTRLVALTSIGTGGAVVIAAPGGGWEVRFAGTKAGKFQAQITGNGALLTGGTAPGVAVTTLSLGGDAGGAAATTDPKGLVSRTYSDPLGRAVRTIENFTDGAVTDTTNKTTDYAYNAAGMTSLTARLAGGGGQTTQYVYGVSPATGSAVTSNDAVRATQWPDAATGAASATEQEVTTINALGQTLTTTGRNGTVHTLTYDILGRVVSDAVTTLGAGVDGAVRRIDTGYDAQGNPYLVTSYDAAAGGNITSQVQRAYNGLGQLTTEWQQRGAAVNTASSPKVLYAYTEMPGGANHSRLASVTYPSGYVLTYNYAAGLNNTISRLSSLSDTTGTVEGYDFLGGGTVVRRTHPQPNLDLAFLSTTTGDGGDKYTGLDRFGRVADQKWVTGTTVKDEYAYTYDRDSNATSRNNLVNNVFGELYTYDGLNQLASFQRGKLKGSPPTSVETATRSQSWDYDAAGNWDSVTTNGTAQARTANKQNEVTSVGGATTPTYDANGNMTGDETGRQFVYDAWNRLVAVKNSGGVVQKTYGYDGLNRRASETAGGVTTDLFYSASWQVLEERVGGSGTSRRYVWSPVYVNAMVLRDRDTNADGATDERLWVTHDANFNVTALVNGSGTVVERYAYDPFGAQTVYDASYALRAGGSLYAMAYGFQGMRYDTVSGLNEAQMRWYSPTLGRWVSQDPIRFAGGDVNLYGFVKNNPTTSLDYTGLAVEQYKYLDDAGKEDEVEATFEKNHFTDVQRRMLLGAMAESSLAINRAIKDLEYLHAKLSGAGGGNTAYALDPRANKTLKLVTKWFTDGQCPVTAATIVTIIKRLRLTDDKIHEPGNRIIFAADTKGGGVNTLAATDLSKDRTVAKITIYTSNFDPQLNSQAKVETIFHEFTHAAVPFVSKDSGRPDVNDPLDTIFRTYCVPGEPKNKVQLSCEQLLDNAYSYEGYVRNYIAVKPKDVYGSTQKNIYLP